MNYNNVSNVGLVLVGRITGWKVLNSISRVGEYWITGLYTEWHKKRELLKNPTKIEEIQEKKLLTEIEPLQLAF